MTRAWLLLPILVAVGCSEAPLGTHDYLPRIQPQLADFNVKLEAAPTAVAALRYSGPTEACPEVYEVLTTYEPATRIEADSISHLALGRSPKSKDKQPKEGEPIPDGEVLKAQIYYHGIRAEKRGVTRDVYISGLHAGPTAPTAGCLPQTWDPIEDTLTLGWPKLTGRVTAVDETWTGLRVAGKCNRSACVDPKTGGGGPEAHEFTCVTMDWQNQLVGIYDSGWDRLAVIRSLWTDGHGEPAPGNEEGIWTERTAVISLTHGRPVWAKTIVHHNFPLPTPDKSMAPITRTWEMRSVDECPGSLASLGWQRSEEVIAKAAEMLETLANSEELRRSHKRSSRTRATRDVEPNAE